MRIKIFTLLVLSLWTLPASAQWTSRANFTGTARAKATTFTIGDKVYLLGGITNSNLILNDFWEYNTTTNTWTQKPTFPGPERYGAVGFVLGNTGYIATGGNDNGHLDDMWQYDPVAAQWIQKTGLPATQAQHENQRAEAFAFVINNKAYLGGGNGWVFGANSTNNIAFNDLWEYNPATNTWTMKTGFPDFIGRNMPVAVAINGKGYVGLGCNVDQTVNHKKFFEYDPVNDSWITKSDFPTNFSADAGAFVLNNEMYVVGGVNLNPVGLSSQVYKYDVINDTWTALPNFNGGAVAGQFCASTGTRAFAGGGYNGSVVPRNDVWEFTTSTGILNPTAKSVIEIYPNPSSQSIFINTEKQIDELRIYDTNGKLIVHDTAGNKSIDIQNLNQGIYFVNIHFADGTSAQNRITKIR